MHRRRRGVVWLCVAAVLLLAAGAPLHGLSHSVLALQASANKDALAAPVQVCEQCLLFAALDGDVPAHTGMALPEACAAVEAAVPAAPVRAAAFTAYVSRAPPRLG